jgi:hypothetical protein
LDLFGGWFLAGLGGGFLAGFWGEFSGGFFLGFSGRLLGGSIAPHFYLNPMVCEKLVKPISSIAGRLSTNLMV